MKQLRGNKTQEQVANELNISKSTYAMIEAGHRFPRKELLEKLSKYYGVTINELFFS
jgi:putative transcriptional regulator